MAFAEGHATQGDSGRGGHAVTSEPSVSSALEHLMASSQGAITKRIDLAMLEGREFVSRTLRGAVLVGLGVMFGAGAWFAAATCLALLATPNGSLTVRLAVFGLLNAGAAVGLVAFSLRRQKHTAST